MFVRVFIPYKLPIFIARNLSTLGLLCHHSVAPFCGSSSHLVKVGDPHQDDSFAEQLKISSSVHLTLDIFEPIYRSGGPALRRPGCPSTCPLLHSEVKAWKMALKCGTPPACLIPLTNPFSDSTPESSALLHQTES